MARRRRCNGVSCGYTRWHRAISRNRFPHTVCAISGDPASCLRTPTAVQGVEGKARINAESAKISVYAKRRRRRTAAWLSIRKMCYGHAAKKPSGSNRSSTKPRRDFGLNATTPFGRQLGGQTVRGVFHSGFLGNLRRRVPVCCTKFFREKRNDETKFRRYIPTCAKYWIRAFPFSGINANCVLVIDP